MKTLALLATVLVLAGCQSVFGPPTPPPEWSTFGASGDVRSWIVAFYSIREQGSPPEHLCGSQAQQFRDFLLSVGVSKDRIRIVEGRTAYGLRHMWIEVQVKGRPSGTSAWYLFDPALNGYLYPVENIETDLLWSVISRLPGDAVRVQVWGYQWPGDRYWDGAWWNKDASGNWVISPRKT